MVVIVTSSTRTWLARTSTKPRPVTLKPRSVTGPGGARPACSSPGRRGSSESGPRPMRVVPDRGLSLSVHRNVPSRRATVPPVAPASSRARWISTWSSVPSQRWAAPCAPGSVLSAAETRIAPAGQAGVGVGTTASASASRPRRPGRAPAWPRLRSRPRARPRPRSARAGSAPRGRRDGRRGGSAALRHGRGRTASTRRVGGRLAGDRRRRRALVVSGDRLVRHPRPLRPRSRGR